MPFLVTAKEAAQFLNVRLPRLYELAREGQLPVVRVGAKQLRFDPDLLRDWAIQGGNAERELDSRSKRKGPGGPS